VAKLHHWERASPCARSVEVLGYQPLHFALRVIRVPRQDKRWQEQHNRQQREGGVEAVLRVDLGMDAKVILMRNPLCISLVVPISRAV
jgi:hypothetical protein